MALSMATALTTIRTTIAAITGIEETYSAGETGTHAVPAAFASFPAVLVLPGPDTGYELSKPAHRHRYEVLVQLLSTGGDLGERAAVVVPFIDAIINKFATSIKLGGTIETCVYRRQSGLVNLTYGNRDYEGYEIVLEVSEFATISGGVQP